MLMPGVQLRGWRFGGRIGEAFYSDLRGLGFILPQACFLKAQVVWRTSPELFQPASYRIQAMSIVSQIFSFILICSHAVMVPYPSVSLPAKAASEQNRPDPDEPGPVFEAGRHQLS